MIKDNKRMLYIDFLKGIAIVMVIMVHFTARLPELAAGISYVGLYGQMGCQLFFVISAYLVCISLWKGEKPTVQFIKNKLMRLMPAYILAIFIHIPVVILLRDIVGIDMNWPRTDIGNIIANIFFVQHLGGVGGFNVLVTGSWYVFCLILFYCMIYAARKYDLVNASNINYVIAASAAMEIVLGIVLYYAVGMQCENNSYYYTSVIVQLPVLLFGVKLYFDEGSQKRRKNIPLLIYTGGGYILTLFLFFSGYRFVFLVIPVLCGMMFYAWIVLTKRAFERWKIEDSLVARVFRKLGEYSYEILFMHVYPVSYGTRIFRVVLERVGLNLNGTALFLILFVPMVICSFIMAVAFRFVVANIRIGIRKVLKC